MRKFIILAAFFITATAQAKVLSIKCENAVDSQYRKSLELSYLISPSETRMELQSMSLNGYDETGYQDVSGPQPAISDSFHVQIRFSVILASHVDVQVANCSNDESPGAGTGKLDMYIGQPLPTVPMTCSCNLQ